MTQWWPGGGGPAVLGVKINEPLQPEILSAPLLIFLSLLQILQLFGWGMFINDVPHFLAMHFWPTYLLVPAAEIRDHETGLISGPFFWFQSRQLFLEPHETEANSIL